MAINPQKFLPPARLGSSLAKISKKVISTDSFSNYGSPKTSEDIGVIKIKVIQIENILKGTIAAEKKALDEKKRLESGKRREKQEEKLETKKQPEKGEIKTPKVPRMGFLDWIKNFIGNVLLGYFAVRMLDFLPKIKPIIGFLGSAADFVIDVGGKLLNGLVSFIDWGYKAIDFTKGMMKSLGGEGAEKAFEGFMGIIGNLVETAIIAAAVIGSMGDGGGEMGTTGIRGAADQAGRSRYGTSAAAARRYAERYGVDAARKKFGSEAVKSLGGKYARSGATNLTRKGLVGLAGKGGTKVILGTVRPLLKRLPIIGALIDFGLSVALGEDPGRAAFKAIGAGLLGSIGAAIGSVVPIAGNIVGGIAGGMLGDAVGAALYDLFFGDKNPQKKNQKVQKKAGGGITRGGKAQTGARRTIGGAKKKGKYKRTLAQKPSKIEIKTEDKTLKETGEQLDKTKYFGPILAITSKIMAKQEPTQKDYENVGLGINLLISKGIEEEQLKGGLIAAFAEGGLVDDEFLEAAEKGSDISNWVAKTFQGEIESNAQKTLRLIKERKEKKEKEEKPTLQTTPEGIPLGEGETASGKVLMQGLIQRGFSKEEAAAIVGNLWAESGFRTTATNPTSGAFGLMQWLGGRKSRLYSYAAEQGKQVSDVNLQLDYIKWELKGGNTYETEQFKKAMAYGTDVASKTKGFAEQVERAGAGELRSSMSKRIGAAESVYGGKMVAGERPSIELGKGYGSEGSKIAGELGRFMKKRGVVPGSIHRHPEHPPYSLTSGHSRGSLHYQGRAIDLGAYANEQGPILSALAEFNRLKGVKPVQLLHAGNDRSGGHNDHVHVAYHRGKVRSGREMIARILKDEKVFDSDTSKAFDKIDPLLAYRLNKASTTSEVMNVLRSYAGYEQPYVEFEIIEVPVPVEVPVPIGDYQSSGGGVALIPFGGGDDPFETLYKGG
jgi:hypothetical protein